MTFPDTFKDTLFERSAHDFNRTALELFRYQSVHCEPYSVFVNALGIDPEGVDDWRKIPCLPIEAFKKHKVVSGKFESEIEFTSSGTTGQQNSVHFVKSLSWYHRVFKESFRWAYGDARGFRWLCLLPSYLERSGSSLIEMAETFIRESHFPDSHFFLRNHDELKAILRNQPEIPTILLGVSFALLDLAEEGEFELPTNTLVMETGGMKGRRKEMIRAELHAIFTQHFHVEAIHSEYGMTEMMSQAYSKGNGLYEAPPWMRINLRDPSNPLGSVSEGKTGGINIIDLANVDSCAFIATQDLGRLHNEHTFEVMGRFDNSDIRGCNLMVQ